MTVVTPTDRPKSVRNYCVIEIFGGVFVLSLCCIFVIFRWCKGFSTLDLVRSLNVSLCYEVSFYSLKGTADFIL